MERKGRIDKYSRDLLSNANCAFVVRSEHPTGPIFSICVNYNSFPQYLHTGQGIMIFKSDRDAISFLKRRCGSDFLIHLRSDDCPL